MFELIIFILLELWSWGAWATSGGEISVFVITEITKKLFLFVLNIDNISIEDINRNNLYELSDKNNIIVTNNEGEGKQKTK